MNDSRRHLMQRLNNISISAHDDAEQAAILADQKVWDNFGTWACVAVMVIALSMGAARAMLRDDTPAEQPQIVNQYLRADYCMTCHIARAEPAIKDLKGYKKMRRNETHTELRG